jgi:Dolichyl-phosphate-mannose-protein mannosyltransferase/LmeA-like phospholipid-binding
VTDRPWLPLAALIAALAAVIAAWVSIDRRPPEFDYANHLERALHCHRILADGGADRVRAILLESSFYPPLVPCLTGLAYFAAPVSAMTAQAVILAFLAAGALAVFGLGRRWLGGTEAGLAAAFFFATAPFVVFCLTVYQLDLPLASMVAVALYALARSEALARARWCAALGVALGLGMLTKPTFATYVLPAVAWAAWTAWRTPNRSRRLGWLAVALVIAAALALPWYGPRLVGMPMQVLNRSFKQAAEAGQVSAFSAGGLLLYPRVFLPQFGLLAGLLCAWGLWAVRGRPGARAYLWASALTPFAIYTLIQNKNLRYTLPILPACALLAAAGLASLGGRWRRPLLWACVALGALQVSATTFAVPPPVEMSMFGVPFPLTTPPMRGDWQIDRVLDDVARQSAGRPATLAVVPNYNFFSVSNFRYEAMKRRLPVELTRGWSGPPLGVEFVLLKTGAQGPSFTVAKAERLARAFADDPYLDAVYPVVGEYPLPDGSRGILRARRIPPLDGPAPADVASRLEQSREAALADYVRDAVGLSVSLQYRPEAILEGLVDQVRVEADAAVVGELARKNRAPLRVRDARIEVDRLLLNPQRLMRTGALEILDAGRLAIDRLTITQADLDEFLRGQPLGRALRISLGDGAATVRLAHLPASARVSISASETGAPFALIVEDARVAGIKLPDFLVSWIARHFDPTGRLKDLPVPVSLASIHIRPGRIQIGPDPK